MTTALIGIDYIVDIMAPGGRMARSADEAARRQVIAHFNAARVVADQRGWPTLLIKVGFEHGYHDQPTQSRIFGKANELGALDLSGPGTDFHPDLEVTGDDVVLSKPRVSGFYGTRLDATLVASGIDRLLIAGVSTTWAVESTARDAHDRDHQVVILEDACAAATAAEHDNSIATLESIATITTSDALADL